MLILILINWLNNIAYAILGYGERKKNRGGKNMKYEEAAQAHHTTAAIWFRFASPKFLLHCVPQKLHIAAER